MDTVSNLVEGDDDATEAYYYSSERGKRRDWTKEEGEARPEKEESTIASRRNSA